MMQRVLATRVRLFQRPVRTAATASSSSSSKALFATKVHDDFADIVYGQDVGVRTVEFNRPKVLNALNLPMVHHLTKRFQKIEANETVNAVVFSGAGDKAFCAGGDIRSLYDNGKDPATRHLVRCLTRSQALSHRYIP